MLVNSNTANKINLRGIKKLLPIPGKDKSAPSSTKKIVNKSEITINGKIYQEVEKHVMCPLHKVSRSSVDSLVDRGTNDGVAGNDARVTSKK